MSCQRCKSEKLITIHGKTSDMFDMEYQGVWKHGYVPSNLFFGKDQYGDYMEIKFCAECGQIQSKFPIAEKQIKAAMESLYSNES
jgi:hypothetical protein